VARASRSSIPTTEHRREKNVTYLDFPKMMGNYWKRPINPYETAGTGGAEENPKDAKAAASIIKDVLVWLGWMAGAFVALGTLVLVPGWLSG